MTVLLPRAKFPAASSYGGITPKIVDGMPYDQANSSRRLMLHMDSTTLCQARELIHI
jgi:hypothetical protein